MKARYIFDRICLERVNFSFLRTLTCLKVSLRLVLPSHLCFIFLIQIVHFVYICTHVISFITRSLSLYSKGDLLIQVRPHFLLMPIPSSNVGNQLKSVKILLNTLKTNMKHEVFKSTVTNQYFLSFAPHVICPL